MASQCCQGNIDLNFKTCISQCMFPFRQRRQNSGLCCGGVGACWKGPPHSKLVCSELEPWKDFLSDLLICKEHFMVGTITNRMIPPPHLQSEVVQSEWDLLQSITTFCIMYRLSLWAVQAAQVQDVALFARLLKGSNSTLPFVSSLLWLLEVFPALHLFGWTFSMSLLLPTLT